MLLALGVAFGLGTGWPGVAPAEFHVLDLPPTGMTGHPRFQVDAGSFSTSAGAEVALALRVPYSELFFEKRGPLYRSRFDLIIVLYDGKKQVGGDLWPQEIELARYADTQSGHTYFQKIVRLPSKPGRYRAEVTLSEPPSGRKSRMVWELEVPDYAREELSISTLWMSGCLERPEAAPDSALARWRGESSLPPADWVLTHRFGEPLGTLCVVGEVYGGAAASGPIDLVFRIHDERQAEVARGDLALEGGTHVPFSFRPDLGSLWLGTYTLEVTVRAAGKTARREFVFQMDESTVSLERGLEQSLELVRVIARSGEVDSLENTSPLERKEAWNRFWKRRDPSPDTAENEFKDEFFRRVRHANEHFSVLEPGWRSDRGRVYIEHGPPDDIDRRPQNLQGPPFEIWLYHSSQRRFVFVDYDGFGRYELYSPGRS